MSSDLSIYQQFLLDAPRNEIIINNKKLKGCATLKYFEIQSNFSDKRIFNNIIIKCTQGSLASIFSNGKELMCTSFNQHLVDSGSHGGPVIIDIKTNPPMMHISKLFKILSFDETGNAHFGESVLLYIIYDPNKEDTKITWARDKNDWLEIAPENAFEKRKLPKKKTVFDYIDELIDQI